MNPFAPPTHFVFPTQPAPIFGPTTTATATTASPFDAPSTSLDSGTAFRPFCDRDPTFGSDLRLWSITAYPEYEKLSFEELRWQSRDNTYTSPSCAADTEEPVISVRQAIKSMLNDPTFADVTFELENGEQISAHRSILSARSPTFKAMFTSGLSESVAGAAIKLDCSAAVLRDMIEFIYTEEVTITDVDTAIELLGRAEEYFLPDLKKRCEEALAKDYLTEDTAPSLMRVADMYRTPNLKKACLSFILHNIKSVNVAELDKVMLAELVYAACSNRSNAPTYLPTPPPPRPSLFATTPAACNPAPPGPTPPSFG